MKKITTTCTLLFLGIAIFSKAGEIELKKSKPSKNHDKAIYMADLKKSLNPALSPQSIIWSDDFSVPANWTINSPSGSGAGSTWAIGTAGPSGSFKIDTIHSTTRANGFGLFDSDKNCSSNQIANITTTNSISCTGHPTVNLSFQEYYERFYDSTFVFVSNNNTTWVKYPVNMALGNNQFCANNPTTVKVNISATAGNQATVWIRFQFYSPTSMGTSAGCGYSWMIDDVSLLDVPANDMAMDRAYTDFSYVDGGYYTQTPKSQVAPLTFRGAVSNQGSTNQTNVKLNVNILNGTSSVYNQNSATANMSVYGVDTLSITATPFTPPATVASYTTLFHVSQTEVEANADTMNNWISKPFAVTDSVYARDYIRTTTSSPNQYTNGDQDGSAIGNIYEFNTDATASSISAYLSTATATGTTIQAKLYSVGGAGFTEIAASATYAINSSTNVGKWVTLPISAPLQMDSTYLAAIVTTGVASGTPNVYVYLGADNVTQQPIRTSYVYTAGDGNWGYISELPMIRLNVATGTNGVNQLTKNNGVKLYQNIPNPTKSLSTINYELDQNATVVLTVYNVVGEQISVQNEGNQSAGTHSIIFNSENFAAGVYYYSLSVGQKSTSTMKMVVIK